VNDLSVCGARPLYISLGLIIEEGFKKEMLNRITASIALAAKAAGVKVAAGDTKVVEKGSCDGIFINTSGIGEVYYRGLSLDIVRPGDVIIVTGGIGEHAISVISKREGISFKSMVKSDSAPLNRLIEKILKASGKVRFMRDPTRGGVGTTLNEVVYRRDFGISLEETALPVRSGVREACELLGFDPLYLACEGRVVIIAAKEDEGKIIKAAGREARVIGKVAKDHKGIVYMNTKSGGKRIVDMLSGEQLPRIC
jgi:hydrogenase expression/formation protein HypE